MINRIILIGNGFDLAHGLKTSYKDFIRDYWFKVIPKFISTSISYKDKFIEIKFRSGHPTFLSDYTFEKKDSSIKEFLSHNQIIIQWKSPFFKHINTTLRDYNWVDIEYEYYTFLKNHFQNKNSDYQTIEQLNEEFMLLRIQLEKYLTEIEESSNNTQRNEKVFKQIYEPINFDDLSIRGKNYFKELTEERYQRGVLNKDYISEQLRPNPNFNDYSDEADCIQHYIDKHSFDDLLLDLTNNSVPYQHPETQSFLSSPDKILFLQFNYTNTSRIYIPQRCNIQTIHIHGALNTDTNPIVFGYGDEMDKSFRELLEQNDNSYLENIKSMHYAETDNYRKLLQFIESAPYQIYIMGHSCGNSDRTLLNTLFEHKNCISIKPFYHKWKDEDGNEKDDYLDKIQNISRNFNDMALMRDRVVNKTYCEPLGYYIP